MRSRSFAFEDGIARAAYEAAATNKVLLSVFLAGGIDGLNVLFPAGDPKYYALRPNLALGQTTGIAYTGDSRLRWHPAMSSIATLYGEGKVSVIPAIGYANSDQSHFTSRHYWEVGATDATLRTGWLGRYLDKTGTADNPLQGLSLDVALQPALATTKVPVATLQAADQYTFAAARCRSASPRVVDPPGGRESRRRAYEVARCRALDGRLDRALLAPPLRPSSVRSPTGSRRRLPTPYLRIPSRTASPASPR